MQLILGWISSAPNATICATKQQNWVFNFQRQIKMCYCVIYAFIHFSDERFSVHLHSSLGAFFQFYEATYDTKSDEFLSKEWNYENFKFTVKNARQKFLMKIDRQTSSSRANIFLKSNFKFSLLWNFDNFHELHCCNSSISHFSTFPTNLSNISISFTSRYAFKTNSFSTAWWSRSFKNSLKFIDRFFLPGFSATIPIMIFKLQKQRKV